MLKDANVAQASELRVFAHAANNFGQAMAVECRRGANLGEDAIRSADFFLMLVRRKVEEARRQLENAQKALEAYESADHTDSEGNSTYSSAHAAQLRAAISEARQRLSMAKEDEEHVHSRHTIVRQETDTMVRELTFAGHEVDSAGSIAYRQVSEAASIIEHYDTI